MNHRKLKRQIKTKENIKSLQEVLKRVTTSHNTRFTGQGMDWQTLEKTSGICQAHMQ